MSEIVRERLVEWLEEKNLEGFFISKPDNVRYVSGYTGEDSYLLLTRDKKYFITDPRYTEQVSYECPDYTCVDWRSRGKSVGDVIGQLAKEEKLKTVAFESGHMVFRFYDDIRSSMDTATELVPVGEIVEEYRAIKTPQEIEYQRASCEIASRAFERIIQDIRPGVTEKELAAKLSYYMVAEGADTQPYGNILISGARTSLLHGIPSNRAIEYGDLVLMDYGCQFNGYMSDMTRTVVVGKATAKQREVYELEQKMVADVENFIKDGVSAKDAYYVSTKAIENTEYFDYHYSGIGHGIGVFVHEIPFMGPRSENIIRENNVMTVEPGIYIPGWGGIRIEDQILVTKDGNEVLTCAPKELIEL